MAKYACEIESIEDDTKFECDFFSNVELDETEVRFIADIGRLVAEKITARKLNKGIITKIKINRNKDGSFFVSVTGVQDLIFAKVWRCDN